MGLQLQHVIIDAHRRETKGELIDAVTPLLNGQDPLHPETARNVVSVARQIAIKRGFVNDNVLIADVLERAGVNHIPVTPESTFGPDTLDENTYPGLFSVTNHLEYGDKTDFVKNVGTAVDVLTPDALYRERGLIVQGIVASIFQNNSVEFLGPNNTLKIDGQTFHDVLMAFNPNLEVAGWTVSPYEKALAGFTIMQVR